MAKKLIEPRIDPKLACRVPSGPIEISPSCVSRSSLYPRIEPSAGSIEARTVRRGWEKLFPVSGLRNS
jgi:hypothetical protein